MTPDEQRTYWREKQRESRARRRDMKAAAQASAEVLRQSKPRYLPTSVPAISASVSCRATIEEIAALGPVRCVAFMSGIAQVLSVLNPRTPVGG